MKSKKEKTRVIISAVISFIMSVCITMLVAMLCMNMTAFQSDVISSHMDASYIKLTQNSLVENLKELAPPSGLPDSIFDDLFSTSMIEKDTKKVVQNTLGGITDAFDSDSVKQLFLNRFTEYANSQKIDTTSTNLDSLADMCVSIYEKQITVPFIRIYAPFRIMFDKAFTIMVISLSALILLLLAFLYRIHHYKHRAIRFCIYSLFASALMIIPIPLFLLIQGEYKNIAITPEQVHALFVSIVQSTLWSFVIGGLIVGLIGIMLLPLVMRMRDKLIVEGNFHH